MLILNVKRMMTLRGIDEHYAYLTRHGFVHQTAVNMVAGQTRSVKPEQLEYLCTILSCTPNDLFEWRESERAPLADDHPLRTLEREQPHRIASLLSDVPVEKLAAIKQFVEELKQKPAATGKLE